MDPATANGPDLETLEAMLDVNYTWGYAQTRQDLRDLYTKAKRGQWIPEDVLDYGRSVDPSKSMVPDALHPLWGSDIYARLTAKEHEQLNVEILSWMLSQFLHGE